MLTLETGVGFGFAVPIAAVRDAEAERVIQVTRSFAYDAEQEANPKLRIYGDEKWVSQRTAGGKGKNCSLTILLH